VRRLDPITQESTWTPSGLSALQDTCYRVSMPNDEVLVIDDIARLPPCSTPGFHPKLRGRSKQAEEIHSSTRRGSHWDSNSWSSRERSFRNWTQVGLTPAVICLLVRSEHEQSEVW
jgi:hypothetical protein